MEKRGFASIAWDIAINQNMDITSRRGFYSLVDTMLQILGCVGWF